MFDWLRKQLVLDPPKKGQTVYKVVELAPAQRIGTKTDKEIQESISTLQAHPGFISLLQRLDTQNAFLKSTLHGQRHTSLEEVQFIQAGIYWSNWLRQEVARASARPIERATDPYEEEFKAFQEIDRQIERVGADE